jgi:hypothetical protein
MGPNEVPEHAGVRRRPRRDDAVTYRIRREFPPSFALPSVPEGLKDPFACRGRLDPWSTTKEPTTSTSR